MNRTEIERFVERWLSLVCTGDLADFAQLLAANPRDLRTGAEVGRELFRARAEAVRSALASLEGRVDDLVIDGERIAWRFTLSGLHRGPLFGYPATHRRIELYGVNFQRLAGEVVVAHYTQLDVLGVLEQMRQA